MADRPIPALSDDGRLRTILRPAVLLLLKQQDGYGYELMDRLREIGVSDTDPGGLYRVLRAMEKEELVRSSWVPSEKGPDRRRYSLTKEGDEVLRRSAASMVDQRRTLGELLNRYRTVVEGTAHALAAQEVLIVDDESDVRLTLWVLFEQRGWLVTEAVDGEGALAACKDHPAKIVVLDHRMPGMSGTQVARKLRAGGHTGAILLYSAYLTPELEAEADELDLTPIGKTDFDGLFSAMDHLLSA